jgi:hypothetical protein
MTSIIPKDTTYERAGNKARARITRAVVHCDVVGEGDTREEALAAALTEIAKATGALAPPPPAIVAPPHAEDDETKKAKARKGP